MTVVPISPAVPDDWESLDAFHGRLTEAEFTARLDGVYAPHADWRSWIHTTPQAAWIRTDAARPNRFYRLSLKSHREEAGNAPAGEELLEQPLSEWTIAIDPGHLGGHWGPMERRSFRIGELAVVQEGDLVLAVAHRLANALRERGAEVVLIREDATPVTASRPHDFYFEAFRELERGGELPSTEDVRARAEGIFYRQREIMARAERVNTTILPDLVIALHIDAAPWHDPEEFTPVEKNGAHILVNGAYMDGELRRDDMRLAMLWRLLNGFDRTEIPLATSVAEAMALRTGLPPITYEGRNAASVNGNPYVWARNLMANRLYDAPVIYLEPWMLNNRTVYPWAALGDYEGDRDVGGELRRSLPAIYAEFVLDGLLRALEH